jgi:ABC-type uncharacterized transport system involved in gliding motility auxiliary subunit
MAPERDAAPTAARLEEALFHLLLFTAAGLLAWLSLRQVWHWDWTAAQRNSLAPQSLALVQRLEAPLRLTCFAPDQGPLRRRILPLLERYQRARPEQIEILWVDPELHPDQARGAGVELTGELLLDYQGRRERLRNLSENQISNALLRLLGRPERWIGALRGHGERALDGRANHDLGLFGQELHSQGYRFQPLDLAALASFPDNLGLLLIAGPQAPLLPGEVSRLRTYVQGGGPLLWLLEPDGLRGLDELARDLGVRVLPGQVLDANVKELGIDDPGIALVSRYPDHPAVRELKLLSLYPKAAALETLPGTPWQASTLLTTLERTWNETGPIQGTLRREPELGEQAGPLTLGLALTRQASAGPEQRALLVGDGDFLSNSFLANAGNRELGLWLVRWVMGEDRLLDIPPREATDRQLALGQTPALVLGLASLVVAPLALLLTGLLIRHRRRRG